MYAKMRGEGGLSIWTQEQRTFRDEVRRFTAEKLPADVRDKVMAGHPLRREDHMRWQDILAEKGWLVGFWPKEYGGCGWTAAQSYIFQEETTYAGAPWLLPFGVNYVGPVIYTFGSKEQKNRHLPDIVSNKVFWCQGYSEPEAGSDLANLKTRAVRDGDHYIVNGSKIWTSYAHWADWIFALVRTDRNVKPQQGISFLLIDLRSKGVSISPIKSIEGERHLNQVFFEDLKVPVHNLVGMENKGWTYAKFLLGHERVLSAEVGKSRRSLDRTKRIARENGFAMTQWFQDRIHRFEVDLMALEWTAMRLLHAIEARPSSGYEASVLKTRGSMLMQQISEFSVEALGLDAVPYEPSWIGEGANAPAADLNRYMGMVSEFLLQRVTTIWGGSNEIQRNIIAKHALGL
jgi:alkylation response protein AidB-like acyl-CoA dehydrogenase